MIVSPPRLLVIAGAVCIFGGCKREEIQVYTAPKDSSPAPQTAREEPAAPRAQRPRPQVTWTLPAGWKEAAADQMSIANFIVGDGGGNATVNITPLPNLEGKETMVINMWREQVGQPPLSEEEAGKALTEVEVAGGKGGFFEIAGTREGRPQRTVTAIQHTPGASWFYKLAGDEGVVAAQKGAFLEFLKTVRIQEPTAAAAAQPEPEPSAQFAWTPPEGWRSVSPGQMQVAKFAVPDQGSAKADVTVSIFPSDTGGTRANVDRWRGQLGLSPSDDASLAQTVTPLDPAIAGADLVDLSNNGRRLIGAIVPRDGRWWFYKLLGDADAVAAARDAFIGFAKQQP